MNAPGFWRRDGLMPLLLLPLSLGMIAGAAIRRSIATPYKAPVPVICIGNLVAGGAGKTPVALAVADRLRARGKAIHFLSRGYGGREAGPLQVDPGRHAAADVGDEPLLLARAAPCWVAHDRAAGARAAVDAGADVIVMDDGFQNPGLQKDVSILVVDGGYGFGNARVMPAGPLREPLASGFARAQAVVLMTPDTTGVASQVPASLPVLRAALTPIGNSDWQGRSVFAFAGIARPEKFFATLESLGCALAGTRAFPDHHPFTDAEIGDVCAAAARMNAVPVTTEKDAVRLPLARRANIETLPVAVQWNDPTALDALLAPLY